MKPISSKELPLTYPLLDPRVVRHYLPEVRLSSPVQEPSPGSHLLAVHVEQLLPATLGGPKNAPLYKIAKKWEPLYRKLQEAEDRGSVAGSFHLYYIPKQG